MTRTKQKQESERPTSKHINKCVKCKTLNIPIKRQVVRMKFYIQTNYMLPKKTHCKYKVNLT